MHRFRLIPLYLVLGIAIGWGAPKIKFYATHYTPAKPGKADIIILGDSRAEQGNWSEGLQNRGIANLGKGGSTSGELVGALPDLIKSYHPRIVLLCTGINDLRQGYPVDTVFARMRGIMRKLRSKGIEPVLLSVIPIRADMWQTSVSVDTINARVSALNARLRVLCYQMGSAWVDLSGLSEGGRLRLSYTVDGIHLNAKGYEVVYEIVKRNL